MPFINTASSAGGDGTTNATTGANRAYVSFSEFNTQETADLVAAAAGITVECDGSGGADTAGDVRMTGWTTNASFFITVNGNRSGHVYRAVDDANGYRLEFTVPGNYDRGIQFAEHYTVVNDFQIELTSSNKSYIAYYFQGDFPTVRRNIAKGVITTGASGINGGGFHFVSCDSGSVFSNLAIDFTEASNAGFKGANGSGTQDWYNNTAHNCAMGFRHDGLDTRGRNLLAQNCTDGFDSTVYWVATTSHNCSDLTSDLPGANGQVGDVLFTDEANDDFELSASDTVALGNGVDLSGTFDFDLANNAMPTNWPIGCMQEAVAGGLTASGTPSIDSPTASGVVNQFKKANGTPAIDSPTASGSATQTLKPSGTVSIASPTASGVSKLIKKASGAVTLAAITAVGVSTIIAAPLTASGTPSIESPSASGVVNQFKKALGTPSIDEVIASGLSKIIKKSTGALSLLEITASGTAQAGGTLDSSGIPSIDEILAAGVSTIFKKSTGTVSLNEITASGQSSQTLKASGTPSIAETTASGESGFLRDSTGAIILPEVTASGISLLQGETLAFGAPSIDEITAVGNVTQQQFLSGAPSIDTILAAGIAKIIKTSSGTPVLEEIAATGVVTQRQLASGAVTLEEITASGVSTKQDLISASGTPSIDEILATGVSSIIKRASGNVTLEEISASGQSTQRQLASGAVSIDEIEALGIVNTIKKADGTPSIAEITASGVSGLVGLLTSSGNPVIDEITATGIVTNTNKATGTVSIEVIAASGTSNIVGVTLPASGTPSIVEIEALGVSALNVVPSEPIVTPTTNYLGTIALDLARPGDIEDPATDRAIAFLHDAVEQLSLSGIGNHSSLEGVLPDQHHTQVHKLYGPDHVDVNTTVELVTGSVLAYVKEADGGENTFVAVPTFVSRGYGGIEQTGTPGMSDLGAGFQVVPANANLLTSPAGVTQDFANDGIRFEKAGVWSVNITVSLTHNEDNGGRTFEIQLYNDTVAAEIKAIPVPVARLQPGTLISLTFMVEISESIEGDLLQIRIGNGSTITSVVLQAYQFSANHISKFEG